MGGRLVLIQATDLPAIKEAVELVLRGVTPEIDRFASDRWQIHERRAGSGLRNRRYRVEFGRIEQVEDGWWDTNTSQHSSILSLVCDYAIPSQYADEVIAHDGSQLHHALYRHLVRGVAVPLPDGDQTASARLIAVEYLDSAAVEESETGDTQKIAHDYVIHFLKDRIY